MRYHGWLAVHAAKRRPDFPGELPDKLERLCNTTFGERWRGALSFGAVIGAVYVVDCQPTTEAKAINLADIECGNWDAGRFAIKRTDYFHIEPMPAVGRQCLFRLPEDINLKLVNEIVSRKLTGFEKIA